MNKKISIQGHEGSFHQQAARHYFGTEAQMIPCASFRELVKKTEDPAQADFGLMAIENSIAGSIMNNYTLLQNSGLKITGEIYLTIRQHLMANPGVKPTDIREVHSHPIALLQCMTYLEKFPHWKLVESQDTAYSAKYIHQHHAKHTAAVAGELAAELFGLEILEYDIQSVKKNYTRFLVLGRDEDTENKQPHTKASVYFHAEHHRGSLAAILIRLAASGINLSKLQSLPIPGTDWQYGFHADMEFGHIDQFNEVTAELKELTHAFRVFGVYPKGRTV